MINISSVYSMFTVSLRFSTAFVRMCLDCGHCFSTSLAMPFPPLFSLSSSFLLSHSPLAVEFTIERSLCADWTEGELYKTYKNIGHIYLALTRSVQSVRKMLVTLSYYLWKNTWINGLVWLRSHYMFTFDFSILMNGITFTSTHVCT